MSKPKYRLWYWTVINAIYWRRLLTYVAVAALIVILLTVGGCAKMFACSTDASYILRANGDKEVSYSSCKEQVGLDASFGDVHVKVDRASTQDAVIAASLQYNLKVIELVDKLSAAAMTKGASAVLPRATIP